MSKPKHLDQILSICCTAGIEAGVDKFVKPIQEIARAALAEKFGEKQEPQSGRENPKKN
ncbi:MAG: hypothetical protein WCV72_04010 [Patescibacteria group bacterium]